MSSERKYTGMAKLFAIEEKQQRERAAEKASERAVENTSPPAKSSPPEIPSPAAINSAPAISPAEPLQTSAAEENTAPAIFSRPEQHTRIPNEIFEDILPTLRTSEQSILLRLYRLTWGFQRDTCHVSMGKLGKACNLSARQVTSCVQILEKRRLIRRVHIDLDNKNQHERGVTFQMLLPQATRAKFSAGEETSANKRNTQKENTQTQDVRVGSKFTIEECRKFAQHLQSTGQGINNPGGYATTIHRTGEADMLIESFLHSEATVQSSNIDTSQCPDCHGTGMYYPEGFGKGGVKKCQHEQLAKQS